MLTHAETALTYNDSSVNENMHASLAFRLLRKPANNFLEARLPPGRVFRSYNHPDLGLLQSLPPTSEAVYTQQALYGVPVLAQTT